MLKVHVIHTAVIQRLTIITSPHISLSFFSKLKIKKKKKKNPCLSSMISALEINALIFKYRTTWTAETHILSLFMSVNQLC